MIRLRCSAPCAISSRPASASAVGTRRLPSSARAPNCWCAAAGPVAATVALAGLDRPQRGPRRRRPPRRGAAAQPQGAERARDRRAADRARPCDRTSVWVQSEGRAVRGQGREHPASGDADPRPAGGVALARSSWRACCTRPPRSAASHAAPALELIGELEGIDRGWYAGPVGWMDAAEDGEFCVGLRSALASRPQRAPLRRLRASSPTPTPPPSCREPSSSSRRCCRC